MNGLSKPPRWSDDQFAADISTATANFREVRMQEPLEQYLDAFEQYRGVVEKLIESTADLTLLADRAVEHLTDPHTRDAVRYIASPAISADDLEVLAEAKLSRARLSADPQMARRVIDTVLLGLDRHRFPWVSQGRAATEAEREIAIVSTTALIATRRVMTDRANTSKTTQERIVADELISMGYTQVPTRTVSGLRDAPAPGEFCPESLFGSRKADLIVGLWDGRQMPVECKVSNSSTNSVKRLNNDAAVKAKKWIEEFGTSGVVPAAVLSGVFKLHNLRSAQADGLTIYWAHDLSPMRTFIEATRP